MAETETEADSPSHVGTQPTRSITPTYPSDERTVVAQRANRPKSTHSGKANSRFSVVEEQQLLADLGVANSQKEETAPRLSDLLAESDVND